MRLVEAAEVQVALVQLASGQVVVEVELRPSLVVVRLLVLLVGIEFQQQCCDMNQLRFRVCVACAEEACGIVALLTLVATLNQCRVSSGPN